MKIKNLKKEISYKWRVQSYSQNKASASCVAYVDARQVMDLLDEVCGAEKWQDDYRTVDGKLFAGIGIKVEDEWIWKWDTGTESQTEKDKGKVSDSFKRASVKWGVGRFLYSLKIKYINTNVKLVKGGDKKTYPYPIDNNGKRVWDITEHINKGAKRKPQVEDDMVASNVDNFQLGACKKCGAPNKKSKTGNAYCSALCWKVTDPQPRKATVAGDGSDLDLPF